MLNWLRDENNRSILKMAGAAIAALCLAGWTFFTYFDSPNKPDPPSPNQSFGGDQNAPGSSNVQQIGNVQGSVTIIQNAIPREEIRSIVDERLRERGIQSAPDTNTDPIEEAVEEAVADLAERGLDNAIEKLRAGDVTAAKEALEQIAEEEEAAGAEAHRRAAVGRMACARQEKLIISIS